MTRKPAPAEPPRADVPEPLPEPVPLPAAGGCFVLIAGQLVPETAPADPATPAVEPGL